MEDPKELVVSFLVSVVLMDFMEWIFLQNRFLDDLEEDLGMSISVLDSRVMYS